VCPLAVLLALLAPAAARAADTPVSDHVDTPAELADVSVAQEVHQARLATAGDTGLQAASLPSTWCGAERTTDDTANAATPGTLPTFKVVYVHPSDRPDRFAQWKDLLQSNASLIGQFVSGQTGSSRAPRFDLGTTCGAAYLDIQTVHLPGTRATYLDNFPAIKTAVRNAVGTLAGPRNYVVLADTLNGSGSGSYGLGDYYAGSASAERPDAANPHNNGNLFAMLFYRDVAAPAVTANGWWPTGMLHEMTHAMGAVQWSAPHTTQPAGGTSGTYGHCWDGLDVMCYADGPAMGHAYDATVCTGLSGAMNQTYDCNQDDYFDPSPAVGSYLATHWDVYNNVFLADCGTLPSGTCVSATATGPPVNATGPAISGTARRGQTLTATVGAWTESPTGYGYQWQRDTGSGYADIAGATSAAYVLAGADVAASVRVRVTATNALGTGQVDANPVGPVVDAIPVNTVAPVITGGVQGGQTLTATVGTWSPAGSAYAFRWQRDSGSGFADVAGATAATYTTVPADVGARLRVAVTATNAYGSTTATAAGVGPIGVATPVSTSTPTITGTARRGQPLVASAGAWNPAATSYAFRWQRDTGSGYADISGATSSSYTPAAADLAATLRVIVTATNAFGTASATTAATAAVAPDPPVNGGLPIVSGTAKRSFTLTASAGSWTPAGSTFAYQWQRDTGSGFADIAGATSPGYVLVATDVGATVRVQVRATNADGSATASSAPSASVVAAIPGPVVAPVVSGSTRVGATLSASTGSWTPAAVSYAYQWQRRSGAAFVDISGQTAATHAVVTADLGAALRVQVTATNADGSATAVSAASAIVTAPPALSGTVPAPTGTLQDASVLTAVPGTWSPAGATFTYQWLRCPSGASSAASGCIPVAMGATYTLVGDDVDHAMAVRVTALSTSGTTAVTSTPTADVGGRALTNMVLPTITGTAQIAETVRATPGTWSVSTKTVRYQWQRCDADGTNCTNIPGAAAQEQPYLVTPADRGHALAVVATATSPGRTASATSVPAVVADQPLPVAGTMPAISGTAARTMNLVLRPGTWANKPTAISYAWQRCDADGANCAPIARATGMNYFLTVADVGQTITVEVTATNTSGTTVITAPLTGVVARVLPELRSAPSIMGIAQVPQLLQAVRMTWTSTSDTRYAFRWQRCDGAGATCVDIAGATQQAYRTKTADARSTLRVVHTATNVDGSVSATSAPSPVIRPAVPGISVFPRLSIGGRPEVGRTVAIVPGTWAAATEIDTKVLRFWRCNPRCVALATGGAGTYVLDTADSGSFVRGSEAATGPGGTLTAWAPMWIGPVRSGAAAYVLAAAGSTATARTASGVALARVAVGPAWAAPAAAATASAAKASAPKVGTLRVAVRRAARVSGTLRAWACVTPPGTDVRQPCTKAVPLRRSATLNVTLATGQRVAVVVVRARKR
jgi:hypothetical protein